MASADKRRSYEQFLSEAVEILAKKLHVFAERTETLEEELRRLRSEHVQHKKAVASAPDPQEWKQERERLMTMIQRLDEENREMHEERLRAEEEARVAEAGMQALQEEVQALHDQLAATREECQNELDQKDDVIRSQDSLISVLRSEQEANERLRREADKLRSWQDENRPLLDKLIVEKEILAKQLGAVLEQQKRFQQQELQRAAQSSLPGRARPSIFDAPARPSFLSNSRHVRFKEDGAPASPKSDSAGMGKDDEAERSDTEPKNFTATELPQEPSVSRTAAEPAHEDQEPEDTSSNDPPDSSSYF